MNQGIVDEDLGFWNDLDDNFHEERFALYQGVVPFGIDSCKWEIYRFVADIFPMWQIIIV